MTGIPLWNHVANRLFELCHVRHSNCYNNKQMKISQKKRENKLFRQISLIHFLSVSLGNRKSEIGDRRSTIIKQRRHADLQKFLNSMALQIAYGFLFLSVSVTCIMLLHLMLHPVFYFTSWNPNFLKFRFQWNSNSVRSKEDAEI